MAAFASSEQVIGKQVMDKLKANVGNIVSVDYVLFRQEFTVTGILKEVVDFDKIVLASLDGHKLGLKGEYLMQGWNSTIKSVTAGDDVLYDNSRVVSKGFRIHDIEEAQKFRLMTFGKDFSDAYDAEHPHNKAPGKVDERKMMQKVIDLIKTYRD